MKLSEEQLIGNIVTIEQMLLYEILVELRKLNKPTEIKPIETKLEEPEKAPRPKPRKKRPVSPAKKEVKK